MSNSFSNYDTHKNKNISKEKKIEYIKNEMQDIEKEIKEVKEVKEVKTENSIVNTSSISLMEVLMVMGFGFGLMIIVLNSFNNAKEREENPENKTMENETTLEQEYTNN